MSTTVTAVILAAGKGTRMRSERPKVLHELAGWPMIAHVLAATAQAGASRTVVVLGHQAEQVRRALPPGTLDVVQEPQRGTGHAVQVALAALPGTAHGMALPAEEQGPTLCQEHNGAVLILYADMPLISAQTLCALLEAHARGAHTLTLLSAVVADPRGYGRVLRGALGEVRGVKEQKELTPQEEAVAEINCGVYCVELAWLRRAVAALPEHSDGEYYLPDLVAMALNASGEAAGKAAGVGVLRATDANEVQGVNTRVQLAAADALMRRRINEAHMLGGVTIVDPATAYIEPGVRIGPDSTILPNTHLRGATIIGAACAIGPDAEVVDSVIGDGTRVTRSVVEHSSTGRGCAVGPFAHLRGGAALDDGVEIGNYAEVKNSAIGRGSVSHHFSYLGDTTMGAGTNVGAGTVTCNYDGVRKHRTVIGDNVFIGSGTMLRAPVTLGNGSSTGAGAVVLGDVAPGTTVAGVPARVIGRRPA